MTKSHSRGGETSDGNVIKSTVISKARHGGADAPAIQYDFSKDDLIREIQNDTPIGKKIIEMHMHYLRSLKDIYLK